MCLIFSLPLPPSLPSLPLSPPLSPTQNLELQPTPQLQEQAVCNKNESYHQKDSPAATTKWVYFVLLKQYGQEWCTAHTEVGWCVYYLLFYIAIQSFIAPQSGLPSLLPSCNVCSRAPCTRAGCIVSIQPSLRTGVSPPQPFLHASPNPCPSFMLPLSLIASIPLSPFFPPPPYISLYTHLTSIHTFSTHVLETKTTCLEIIHGNIHRLQLLRG